MKIMRAHQLMRHFQAVRGIQHAQELPEVTLQFIWAPSAKNKILNDSSFSMLGDFIGTNPFQGQLFNA